ncbi:MAG: adenylosuccinate lyase [Acidobacteriota bacterium]
MIPRYTLPAMGDKWTDKARFDLWLKVEIAACEAWTVVGRIPKSALETIRRKASFELERIAEIEAVTRHDVIAFLQAVAENVGPDSRYIHVGMTSSDVLDTALALQIRDSIDLLLESIQRLRRVLRGRTQEFRDTPMIGRTHGIHAEPTTFGLKLAVWYAEIGRDIERLEHARKNISFGKISGAVGTFAHVPPQVERHACRLLGLEPAPISTQILQRDRHAEVLAALAILGSSIDKFSTEIRHLQRTEVREAEEYFQPGQKGSSAMPHKRNPIQCEQLSGLARLLRSNLLAALENIPLWHERDISHSSVERVILPDSFILAHYLVEKFTTVVDRLLVYPRTMARNLELTGGLIYSQEVLLALARAGMSREEAYAIVQGHAMDAWAAMSNGQPASFKRRILRDRRITKALKRKEIEACFDLAPQLKYADAVVRRVLKEK